ncbi:MAG: hypothetical protein ACOCZ9_02790 [Spirochaetota bacterium]
MRKNKWLRGLAISAGAFVVVIVVSGLVSCADLFGPDDGGGGDGNGASGSESADVDPMGTWLVVLDESAEGPTGVDFQAALAEVDDAEFTIVFYGEDIAQVAGLRGSYEVDGETVDCLMNIGWFSEDPEDPDAPELVGEWTATDWYEVVEDDAMELSVTFDGTTLYGGGEGEIEFDKVSFSRPLDLVNRWVHGEDDVELYLGGSFTYEYYDSESEIQQEGGGPIWESCESDGRQFLRQVYDDIRLDGDPMDLNYWEFLSPYELRGAGDTMRIYEAFDLSMVTYIDYGASE